MTKLNDAQMIARIKSHADKKTVQMLLDQMNERVAAGYMIDPREFEALLHAQTRQRIWMRFENAVNHVRTHADSSPYADMPIADFHAVYAADMKDEIISAVNRLHSRSTSQIHNYVDDVELEQKAKFIESGADRFYDPTR